MSQCVTYKLDRETVFSTNWQEASQECNLVRVAPYLSWKHVESLSTVLLSGSAPKEPAD